MQYSRLTNHKRGCNMDKLPEIIAAYIAMDQRRKDEHAITMKLAALRNPASNVVTLTLVSNRTKN
jgi:hypothetical protein